MIDIEYERQLEQRIEKLSQEALDDEDRLQEALAAAHEAESKLHKTQSDLDDMTGLLKALVMALKSGASSEEILAEINEGLGLTDAKD